MLNTAPENPDDDDLFPLGFETANRLLDDDKEHEFDWSCGCEPCVDYAADVIMDREHERRRES